MVDVFPTTGQLISGEGVGGGVGGWGVMTGPGLGQFAVLSD